MGRDAAFLRQRLRPRTPEILRFSPIAWSGDPCPVIRGTGHEARATRAKHAYHAIGPKRQISPARPLRACPARTGRGCGSRLRGRETPVHHPHPAGLRRSIPGENTGPSGFPVLAGVPSSDECRDSHRRPGWPQETRTGRPRYERRNFRPVFGFSTTYRGREASILEARLRVHRDGSRGSGDSAAGVISP